MIPLHKLKTVKIDPAAEVRKIVASGGRDRAPGASGELSQVYTVYRNLKTLGFFRLIAEAYGNRECTGGSSQRINDLFSAETVDGHIYFVTEITHEALEAFLDDGLVLYKLRSWLTDCFRKACVMPPGEDIAARWDGIFHAPGTPLPKGVKVLPFYNKALAPGVPGVILALVFEKQV
ncbi:hypothetical protein [Methanocella sp. MCL-LM]|uniref:hypothetical protein n=1 Tax=Methanocella sp. MCL-LM TaxID=3412035 RepID=UPI003C75F3CC